MRQVVIRNNICTKYDATSQKYSIEETLTRGYPSAVLSTHNSSHLMVFFEERISLSLNAILAHVVYS
jgi:hypothetical protein